MSNASESNSPPVLAQLQTTAFNYAENSDNRIHADDVAQQFGFRGGLVPGVGDYAYMARAAQRALGDEWLDSGWMEAKFIRPIYHGDRVTARASASAEGSSELGLELLDSDGTLCGIGRAGEASPPAAVRTSDPLPSATKPPFEERPAVSLDALAEGTVLGSVNRTAPEVEAAWRDEPRRYADLDRTRDDPRASTARLHPAYLPELGNDLLVANVELGPWIHSGTLSHHLGPLLPGRALEVRGRVSRARIRKGRDEVELEISVLQDGKIRACLRHSAIVRLPTTS